MEKIHNVNLQPLTSVKFWDTKRIKSYKDRIQKHISYLEVGRRCEDVPYGVSPEDAAKQDEIILQRFKNYKEELKKILENREHII